MKANSRGLPMLLVACALSLFASPGLAAETAASHRVVIQVSENDPARMNLAITNTSNAIKYYHR